MQWLLCSNQDFELRLHSVVFTVSDGGYITKVREGESGEANECTERARNRIGSASVEFRIDSKQLYFLLLLLLLLLEVELEVYLTFATLTDTLRRKQADVRTPATANENDNVHIRSRVWWFKVTGFQKGIYSQNDKAIQTINNLVLPTGANTSTDASTDAPNDTFHRNITD